MGSLYNATRIYGDLDYRQTLSNSNDVYYCVVSFDNDGQANFYVDPDSGLDVVLEVGTTNDDISFDCLVKKDIKGKDGAELIENLDVVEGRDYYIRVSAYNSLSSSKGFLLRCKNYPEIMSVSNKLIDFLCEYEQFRPEPYRGQDSQNETIGYGHVIKQGESFTRITELEGKELLKKDLESREETVANLTKGTKLSQQEFDALVNFQLNTGGLKKSTLLKDVRNGSSLQKIEEDFCAWIKVNGEKSLGLWRRRMDEFDIYAYGEYTREYRNW